MEELAAVRAASKSRPRINAGHGLNCTNVKALVGRPEIEEFSLGHSGVARDVPVGMERAVKEMLSLIQAVPGR